MSAITPLGTAVGPYWQYRLRRDSLSTSWRDWSADPQNPTYFDKDPDGGELRLNTTYWLHARNSILPDGLPGSVSSELAASLQITDTGRVVPVSATGKVDDLSTTSSSSVASGFLNLDQVQPGQLFTAQLINNKIYAVAISRTQLVEELLNLIGSTSALKTLLCELVASCDLPASDTYEWIIDEQYEEVIDEVTVPTGLTILIDSADFAPSGTGIFRIAGPVTLVEGAAGQYSVEEQLTTGAWAASSASVVWSTVGAPSGVSINSGSGLLTVGANTLSADVSISVHAALLNSVIELPVTLSNTAPAITGYHISGPATLSEGATSATYYVIIDYADSSTLVYVGSGTFSLVGAPSGVSLNGGSNAQCSITATLNSVSANTDITLRFTLPNSTVINKTVTIQDLPCTSHAMLTQSQYDALPGVFIYEYLDTATPNGPLSYTVRAFASRTEAIANVPLFNLGDGYANYDVLKVTTSNCSVGDVLYGDNRTEHIQAATNGFYPVEAGYWGFNLTDPANSQPGSFVLLQTNACGEIVNRETIVLPAVSLAGVQHTEEFSVNSGSTPPTSMAIARGTWNFNGQMACQTGTSVSDTTPLLLTQNGNALDRTMVLARVKPHGVTSAFGAYVGVGIRMDAGGDFGYSLLINSSGQLNLVHNGLAFGPDIALPVLNDTWYWMRLVYEARPGNLARISGRFWAYGASEPTSWTLVWDNQPALSGYPALFGGSSGATACFDVLYDGQFITS